MADPLKLLDAFGLSLEDAFLFSAPEEEWYDDEGGFSPSSRTLVLRLQGGRPKFVAAVPFPLYDAWVSPHGATYCTTLKDHVCVYRGDWTKLEREEIVGGESTIWSVWGMAGSSLEDDVVFVGGVDAFFVRQGGTWQKVVAPRGSGKLQSFHGLSPNEVYIASEQGILMWDGKSVSRASTPDDRSVDSVLVVSDSEILVTSTGKLYRWRVGADWSEVPHDYEPFRFARLGSEIFALDYDHGVVRVDGTPTLVAPLESSLLIREVGDGLVAISNEIGDQLYYDGRQWHRFSMPTCEPGGLP